MWKFCQGRPPHQLFSLLREFTLSWCVYILNLPPKAQRMCWDVPAALSSSPSQGSPAATELQRFWALSCSCFGCVCISWDVVIGMENQNEIWDLQLLLGVSVLSECSKWDFRTADSLEYLPSLWGDEWLFELNFGPALPSFIKHLMMTDLAIKSRWFQSLEGNVFQWLYLGCLQPRG